ncbi:hypothetical protein ACWCP6_00980 [Streptomyces sp. NPDC002004]
MRTVRALAAHETRVLVSLGLWLAGRRHGVRGRERAFGYARGQGAVMAGLTVVCLVETFGMSVLLRGLPVLHGVVLVLDVYTVLLVVGLYAASVTRPHVLGPAALRIRDGARVDLTVPLDRIAAVRRETRSTHEPRDGELNLPVGAQTSVTVELAEPVGYVPLLGRRSADVRLVRLHADDPEQLVLALTRARTGPSPSRGSPG